MRQEQQSRVSTEPTLVELLQCKPQLSFFLAPSAEGAVCDSPAGLCAGAPRTGTALACPAAAFLHTELQLMKHKVRGTPCSCMGRTFPC